MEITYDDFKKVQIKLGTVLSVEKNEKARKPSLVVKVDFGKDIGIKQSSAQITHYYSKDNLVGKQVIGVCNFPKKNIAGVVSEVLILGAIEKDGKVVLVHPSQKADNGLDIQEFMIVPTNANTFKHAVQISCEIFHTLKKINV